MSDTDRREGTEMTTNLTKCVCVWLDETSDAEPTWVVSLDELDGGGRAVTTRTLDTDDDEASAVESGREEARRRGLPLYRNPSDGPAELVEEAPAAD